MRSTSSVRATRPSLSRVPMPTSTMAGYQRPSSRYHQVTAPSPHSLPSPSSLTASPCLLPLPPRYRSLSIHRLPAEDLQQSDIRPAAQPVCAPGIRGCLSAHAYVYHQGQLRQGLGRRLQVSRSRPLSLSFSRLQRIFLLSSVCG